MKIKKIEKRTRVDSSPIVDFAAIKCLVEELSRGKGDFRVGNKDSCEYSFDDKNEFLKYMEVNMEDIESFNLYYYEENMDKIKICCEKYYTSFSVNMKDEGKALKYDKFLNNIFKEKSWNNFVNSGFSYVYVPIASIVVLLLVIYLLFFEGFRNFWLLMFIWLGSLLFLIFFDRLFFSKKYPDIVFKKEGELFGGRVLKKDLWKFVVGLGTVVVIPFLINMISK